MMNGSDMTDRPLLCGTSYAQVCCHGQPPLPTRRRVAEDNLATKSAHENIDMFRLRSRNEENKINNKCKFLSALWLFDQESPWKMFKFGNHLGEDPNKKLF